MTAGSRREYLDCIALRLANGVRTVSLRELHRVLAHAMPPTKGPATILHRRLALPFRCHAARASESDIVKEGVLGAGARLPLSASPCLVSLHEDMLRGCCRTRRGRLVAAPRRPWV